MFVQYINNSSINELNKHLANFPLKSAASSDYGFILNSSQICISK